MTILWFIAWGSRLPSSWKRNFFICNLNVGRLHWQVPVLEVVVEIESLLQHYLFIDLHQAQHELKHWLVRLKWMIKVSDICGKSFHWGLIKDAAIISKVGRLTAEQVDFGVVCLTSAWKFGSKLCQFSVCAMYKLWTIIWVKPCGGVGSWVGPYCPRLIINTSLIVLLNPLCQII